MCVRVAGQSVSGREGCVCVLQVSQSVDVKGVCVLQVSQSVDVKGVCVCCRSVSQWT